MSALLSVTVGVAAAASAMAAALVKAMDEAGDGFDVIQESEEFKLANELRVEFTYLQKIADLVKL